MYPAPTSTAMPSGLRQPVTRVFVPEPSGLIENTRPPLKSRTKRRSAATPVAAAPVDRDVCCCVMAGLPSTGNRCQGFLVLQFESMASELGDGDHQQPVLPAEALEIGNARHRAVVVDDLADNPCRLQTRQGRQIHRRLGVAASL